MPAKVPTRSALKQSSVSPAPAATNAQKAQAEQDRKNLQIALKHAYLIQHRKDVEAGILDSITVLMDFPAAAVFTGKEAVTFLDLVRAFQPSDYDSLVEERRVAGRCGYVLCANVPRTQKLGPSAAWKLQQGRGDWCSEACARKGLYIKTQLSEVPAWERIPEQQPDIRLHEDDRTAETDSAMRRADRTAQVDGWRQKVANDEELAMERGEKATSFRPKQVMTDMVVEKKSVSSRPTAPHPDAGEQHSSIEGYLPTWTPKRAKDESNESDDD